jgi:hypothetical protein
MASKIDPTVQHPDYPALLAKYQTTQDAFNGDVAEYVEKIPGMSVDAFQQYCGRAAYFNLVERTTQAIIGSMMRKPFKLAGMDQFPVTDFESADAFLQDAIRNEMIGARTCILVDVDPASGKSKLISYDACDVINWLEGKFYIIQQCSLVQDPDNPYQLVEQNSWLELYLDENGLYASRVWTLADKNNNTYVSEDQPQLLVNGKPINYIPFFVANPYDNTWCGVFNPPLFTQASLNLQHYKLSLDIAHYCRHMALPTFTIMGDMATYSDDNGTQFQAQVRLGSTEDALHLAQGSQAKYIEVNGMSYASLKSERDHIEENMYVTGSRLLMTKRGVESVEALSLRSNAEGAVLETVTNALESALNQALVLCGEIDRSTTVPVITLNKDFSSSMMEAAMVNSLLQLYVAGAITLEEFQQRLFEGEVIGEPGANNDQTGDNDITGNIEL